MRRLLALAVLLAGICAPSLRAGSEAPFPKRVEIAFAVYMGSMRIGEGYDRFEHNGRTYQISSESKTVGMAGALYRFSVVREVKGRLTSAGLRPESYVESRNGKLRRSARFDWDRKQATLVDGDKTKVVPLPEDTWDTTSFGYNFSFARPQASELVVNLTDGRRIKGYRYAIVGNERLKTEIGTLDTLRMKRVQDADDKRSFEVWLAVDRHYAPVRIRYAEKDGTVFDSVVTKLQFSAN